MNRKLMIMIVIAVILVGVIWFFGREKEETPKQSMVPYSSTEYKLSFDYPSGLYLKERMDVGTEERPQLALVLVEDTQVNRDILEGKSELGGEGPTAITVDVYQNPKKLSAEEWAKQDTNWLIGSKTLLPVAVGKQKGFWFTWDGLYQGKSVVVTKGTLAYVFSVTWISPEDQLIKDFDMVLNSTVFGE